MIQNKNKTVKITLNKFGINQNVFSFSAEENINAKLCLN